MVEQKLRQEYIGNIDVRVEVRPTFPQFVTELLEGISQSGESRTSRRAAMVSRGERATMRRPGLDESWPTQHENSRLPQHPLLRR
jgi:hypothetical protein